MKVLRSYVCRPSDVVSAVFLDGILKFTMSGTGCWKRYDWKTAGTADFEQDASVVRERIFQRLSVGFENDEFVATLMEVNDLCEVYAAHFAEDGRVFFQGFECDRESDRAFRGSFGLITSGKYRAVGEGIHSFGLTIQGCSRSLATIIAAENAAKQEQYLQNV